MSWVQIGVLTLQLGGKFDPRVLYSSAQLSVVTTVDVLRMHVASLAH